MPAPIPLGVHINPLEILKQKQQNKGENRSNSYLRICAPMVRYSKLPFRELVRRHGVDVAYTPMILAGVFKCSKEAQRLEFLSNPSDSPVVVQFAASNPIDFAEAAALVAPFCSGVDLNCGCPQPWAIAEGIGSHCMSTPDLVADMVRAAKAATSTIRMKDGSPFPISVKIRIHRDIQETLDFVRKAVAAGVDWITVHGRTKKQRHSDPVDYQAIRLIKATFSDVPIFANGDIFSLEDADHIVKETQVDGVMCARGLLENPALFDGHSTTPVSAVKDFLNLALGYGLNCFIFHHHLMYMLDGIMTKQEKKRFNVLSSIPAILDYLEEHYGISIDNS